jgi:AraC-like DNA-binding protein
MGAKPADEGRPRIVETRRLAPATREGKRGILRPLAEGKLFRLERFQPEGDLRVFVDRFWSVRWDLTAGEPYASETLPNPSVNVSVEPGKSAVYGIVKRKFTAMLEGNGQVIGAKFRPAMFAPFAPLPAASLTGRVVSLGEIWGVGASGRLEREVLEAGRTAEKVGLLEAFLRRRLPPRNAEAEHAAHAAELALADREIATVEDLADRCHVSVRALQRLFRRWVGAPPKWVIRRARVQEAAERVAEGGRVNWARLASELGYFDQTHFIKDFRAQIGLSPSAYAKECRTVGA